jgi:hypothetical protein
VKISNHPPTKPSSEGQVRHDELSEAGNLLRLCTLITLGSTASAIVIGACRGTLDDILAAVLIAGAISLCVWLASLPPLIVGIVILQIFRLSYRRPSQRSPRRLEGVNGMADHWLDGPA